MNGNKFLLDTNAITALLQGNQLLIEQLKKAEWIGISIISQLEFLANPALHEADKLLFNTFLKRVHVIDLVRENSELIDLILTIRTKYKLKLPDAIIAACALHTSAILISEDSGFANIRKLKVLKFT